MEASLQMLCDMGFPRPEAERCLRAAFGNADRAVEYLMNGIPAAVQQQLQQQQQAAAAAAAAHAAGAAQPPAPGAAPAMPAQVPAAGASPFPQLPGAARGAPAAGAGGPLAALRTHPRFGQLRMVAQQSPQMLNQVLSAMAVTDPSIINLIAEHQAEFVTMLQDTTGLPPMVVPPAQGGQLPTQPPGGQAAPPAGGALQPPLDPVAAMLAAAQAAQAQAGGAAPAMGGAAPAMPQPAAAPAAAPAAEPPQAPSVQLTAAEQEAVGRLQALGFERSVVVEAFLACDRNEEVAANYLFESMED